jgi:hypothetical protein
VEQKLMLLGMEAGLGRTAFAEVEELAEGVAELGQGLQSLLIVRLLTWRLTVWTLMVWGWR